MPVKIAVEFNMDTGLYELTAASHGFAPMPAGPRLLKAQPHPKIAFTHTSLAEAERDAAALQEYVDGTGAKKVSNAKERKVSV